MTCTKCGEAKTSGDFYSYRAKDGKHPVCKECRREQRRAYYEKDKRAFCERAVALRREKEFGVSPEDYDAMLTAQEGVCAVCGKPETQNRADGVIPALAVDHCHDSGKVRGLLCSRCNRALGLLGDDPERVASLLKYIAHHNPTTTQGQFGGIAA